MKQKYLLVVSLALLLIGFSTAQDNVVDVKHETIAIYVDDTSLPSIQAKGDVVRVAVLGAYVSDEDGDINHVISLSDAKVTFHIEYYVYKDDEIRIHLTLTGPTMITEASPWQPVQKGFQYKSPFSYENLKASFKKGTYEVLFYIESKGGGAGTAYSDRCLVKFN